MSYLIKLEINMEGKILLYCGNMLGEVYIYEVTNVHESFRDTEAVDQKGELKLLDMIITGDPFAIRAVTQVSEKIFATATENDYVRLHAFDENLKQ